MAKLCMIEKERKRRILVSKGKYCVVFVGYADKRSADNALAKFKTRFKDSPVKRAKLKGMKRNAEFLKSD